MIAILLALLAVVNTTNNSVSYTCNGVTATYSVNYPYLSSSDLTVTSTTVAGAVTTLTQTTDWSVNASSTSSTATLTLTNPAVKCPNTNVLKISRNRAFTQPYGFRAQSFYNQALHETAYDSLEMQIQQLVGLQSLASPVANNTVLAGPITGGPLPASFRLLDVTDIPSLPSSQISGTFGDGSLSSSYSGVGACAANSWASTLTRNAAPTCTQPAFSNISGSLDTSRITTGTLTQARGGTGSIAVTCAAGTFLTSNGTSYSCGAAVGFLASLNTWAASQLFSGGITFSVGSISSAGVGVLASLGLTTPLPVSSGGTGAATVANSLAFIGPAAGGPLAPSFRALVAGDIPALDSSKITTGTFSQARGGTGAGALTCAAGDFITSNGTLYSCATPAGGGGVSLSSPNTWTATNTFSPATNAHAIILNANGANSALSVNGNMFNAAGEIFGGASGVGSGVAGGMALSLAGGAGDSSVGANGGLGLSVSGGSGAGANSNGNGIIASSGAGGTGAGASAGYPLLLSQNNTIKGHLLAFPLSADPTSVEDGSEWWTTTAFKTRVGGTVYTLAPLKAGVVALVSGTPSTKTVTLPTTGMVCTCTETTTAANNGNLKCSVATTTLTITGPNTVADNIAYTCMVAQ